MQKSWRANKTASICLHHVTNDLFFGYLN